jgi:APA family basic amino acid/polyamine antiporter
VEVAKVAADYMFGPRGGAIMGLLICFGLVSTISSMVWAGPRVTQVMGEDYRLFGFLSRRNRWGAPIWAILAQSAIVMILLLFTDFEQIIYYIQAILTLSSLLVVAGM